MWKTITETFRTVFEVEWSSEDEMWAALSDALGCSKERAQYLGKALAFCAPFTPEGTYLGLPTEGSCIYCAQAVLSRGMCNRHYRSYNRAGEFGVFQYHRLCTGGEHDKHSAPVLDAQGTPRCTRCKKSLIALPPDIRPVPKLEDPTLGRVVRVGTKTRLAQLIAQRGARRAAGK